MASRLADEPIYFDDGGKDWINEALDDIGPDAQRLGEVVVQASEGVWYDLPKDCLQVREVRDPTGERYQDYQVQGNRIRFERNDTFTVQYVRLPRHVRVETDEIDLHDVFMPALAAFIIARFKGRSNPQSPQAQQWTAEYVAKVQRAIWSLSRRRRVVRVLPWR